MSPWPAQRSPMALAFWARLGVVPLFLLLGLLVGVLARGWMRLISTEPEFTWAGTLGIIGGFGFFATMQSIAALASATPWSTWPRRLARCLGLIGLLPLFVAAGAVMAPFVVLAGLATWHPSWPPVVRGTLAALALANLAAVGYSIVSDHGLSLRSALGFAGLVLLYAGIVWAAAGTFAPARPARRPVTPAAA